MQRKSRLTEIYINTVRTLTRSKKIKGNINTVRTLTRSKQEKVILILLGI